MSKKLFSKRILLLELLGFVLIIVFLWLDEVLDLPHTVFGGPPTPINFTESIIESTLALFVGIMVIGITFILLSRIKYLEGFLSICASCKKIRDEKGFWKQIECYIRDHSAAEFSHGICPDCAEKLYPELYKKEDTGKPEEEDP